MISELISVIIPVYNGEQYLAQAIDSVLGQTCPPAEIIVVDDGSTDGSADIARAFGTAVRCVAQANLGPAAARNLAVKQAGGNLLAFLDADDVWLPDKLECQLAALASNPGREAVLGRVENFLSPELDEAERRILARAAQQGGEFHVGALLLRRSAFTWVGSFDTRWRHGEFVEWWARATRLKLNYVVAPQLVLRRRLHTSNLTRREQHHRPEYLRILREQLALRRNAAAKTRDETPL